MDIRRENLVIPYKYYSNFPDKLNLITNVIMTVTSLVRVGSHSIRSGLFAPPVLFYVGGALAAGADGDPVGKRRRWRWWLAVDATSFGPYDTFYRFIVCVGRDEDWDLL